MAAKYSSACRYQSDTYCTIITLVAMVVGDFHNEPTNDTRGFDIHQHNTDCHDDGANRITNLRVFLSGSGPSTMVHTSYMGNHRRRTLTKYQSEHGIITTCANITHTTSVTSFSLVGTRYGRGNGPTFIIINNNIERKNHESTKGHFRTTATTERQHDDMSIVSTSTTDHIGAGVVSQLSKSSSNVLLRLFLPILRDE